MKTFIGLLLLVTLAFAQPDPLVEWCRYYGDGCEGFLDEVWQSLQTRSGDFVIAGHTQRFYQYLGAQALVMRFSTTGDTVFDRGYGPLGYPQSAFTIIQVADGGFVAAGYGYNPDNRYYLLFKIDSLGTQEWSYIYPDGPTGPAYGLRQMADGGFLLSGADYRANNNNCGLVRTDSAGRMLWSRALDYDNRNEIAVSLVPTQDGGCLVAGTSRAPDHGRGDLLLFRCDANGDTLWRRLYNYSLNQQYVMDGLELADGSFIINGGESRSNPRYALAGLTKISADGDWLWQRGVSLPDSSGSSFTMSKLSDGYLLGGQANDWSPGGDAYLVKLDWNGYELWHRSIHVEDVSAIRGIHSRSDGRLIIIGEWNCVISPVIYPTDVFILQTGPGAFNAVNPESPAVPQRLNLSAYPNPFNATSILTFELNRPETVTLILYDLQGRQTQLLLDKALPAGPHNIMVQADDLASGAYFARLQTSRQFETIRLVLVK